MLYQIPEEHHPEERYLVHLFTRALLGYLSFPLDKRTPRTLDEAYSMAARIEENISFSEIRCLFTSGTLNRESLFSLRTSLLISKKKGNKPQIDKGLLKTQPRSRNPMTKYQHALLLLMKQSTSLLHLHNNKTIRLVSLLFRILMIPCSMIQKVKEEWNP